MTSSLPQKRRRYRPVAVPVAQLGQQVTQAVIGRKNAALGQIYRYWSEIIGMDYHDKVRLRQIKAGKKPGQRVVEVACDPSDALLLSHDKAQILRRLNQYASDQVFSDVIFVQSFSTSFKSPPPQPTLSPEQEKWRADLQKAIPQTALAQSLDKLLQAVLLKHSS